MAELAALLIGVLGVAGLVFTALKYNRDDTTAIVNQQSVIVGEMKTLNDELRTTVGSLREENGRLRVQVEKLTTQISEFRKRLDG